MARIGLGEGWRCLFANDFDEKKCAAYRDNFGARDLVEADIAGLAASDLPAARADLAWGSFPDRVWRSTGALGQTLVCRPLRSCLSFTASREHNKNNKSLQPDSDNYFRGLHADLL